MAERNTNWQLRFINSVLYWVNRILAIVSAIAIAIFICIVIVVSYTYLFVPRRTVIDATIASSDSLFLAMSPESCSSNRDYVEFEVTTPAKQEYWVRATDMPISVTLTLAQGVLTSQYLADGSGHWRVSEQAITAPLEINLLADSLRLSPMKLENVLLTERICFPGKIQFHPRSQAC